MRYHLMTVKQVTRLLFANDIGHVRNIVANLRKTGCLTRAGFLPQRSPSGKGAAPPVYQLAAPARRWLHEQGYPVGLKELSIQRNAPLEHTISVNDVLIAAELFTRSARSVHLEAMSHEFDLHKQPFKAVVDDERLYYTPDGWFDLRIAVPDGEKQECFALEIDRATEDQRRWREKIRGLLAWSSQAYEQQFGTSTLTVAVVAVCGVDQVDTDEGRAKRAANLKRWTEAELLAHRNNEDAPDFCFLGADPVDTKPEQLFCAPLWSQPFSGDMVPLLFSVQDDFLETVTA